MKDNTLGLTKDQMDALEKAVTSNENLFITGGAGTGKSYLINEIKNIKEEHGENVALCAPTGVAADNIDGVTLHRLFGIGIGPLIDPYPDPPRVLKAVDTVIIDEISMVRCDIFEHVMRCIDAAEKKWGKKIQIVVVGDFYQLPPILDENKGIGEKDVLIHHYQTRDLGKLYAFQSPLWQFGCAELTKVMRQEDPDFSQALNLVRRGDPSALPWLDAHRSTSPIDGAPYGVSTNNEARRINSLELDTLDKATEHSYIMDKSYRVNDSDMRPFEHEVTVRNGALVMILINDRRIKPRYVNGTIARVISSTEDSVTVVIPKNWETVTFGYYSNPVFEYGIDRNGRLEKNIIGYYSQMPLKLCYAMTIHKMQGLTFDALNLSPATWEDGMLYTALSRVKSVDKLYYPDPLADLSISCNSDVSNFYVDPERFRYAWPTDSSYDLPDCRMIWA